MPALYDHPALRLPYRAVAPWPIIEFNGQPDWVQAVCSVEDWLERSVGPHYREWCWDTWTLHNAYLCGVTFRQEKSCTLFLLAYSCQRIL